MAKRLIITALLAAILGAAPARAQVEPDGVRPLDVTLSEPGSITMRPAALVPADQPVVLSDIAILRGGARALAETVIDAPEDGRSAARKARIRPDDVSEALSNVDGLDWSLLCLRGADCEINYHSTDSRATPERGHAANAPDPLSRFEGYVVASSIVQSAPRGHAARALAELFEVSPGDIRVSFERTGASLLDADVASLTVQAHPLGAGDRVPVRIRIFDPVGERLVRSDVVHARVEIRTDCSRLLATLRRGALIEEQHVRTAREWIEPSLRAASPSNVVGSALRRTLEEGRVVTETDIEPPTLVRRGDKVSVHCVSGSLVLRVTARAMDSARRGEIIELESLEPDRRDRRRFTARVSGPGEAVASAETDLSIAGHTRPGG